MERESEKEHGALRRDRPFCADKPLSAGQVVYAFVSTRAHQGYQGVGNIAINRTDLQRGYGHFLLRPRTVGVTFSYQFEM